MNQLNIEKVASPQEAFNFVGMIYPELTKELEKIQEKAAEENCQLLVRDVLLGAVYYWMTPDEESEDEE